jgi:hypothetical protein
MRSLPILALVVLVAAASSASADDVTVDWGRGLVTAEGIGIADRHAPSPAVARGTSRRSAEDAARQRIAKHLAKLPLAGGGTLGDKAKDPAIQARIDRAVAAAYAIAAEPETDGAWKVTMAVPIEAIRQAIDGPRTLPAKGDAGPSVIVIDGAAAKPAVGWQIAGTHGPAVWVKSVPAWAKDAPHAKAGKAANGSIDLAGTDATDATLFVIVAP